MDFLQKHFTQTEIDRLASFKEDKQTFEAVKKYLTYYLYEGIAREGEEFSPNENYALQLAFGRQGENWGNGKVTSYTPRTNEELGEDLRALARGIAIIASGFKEISEITKPVKIEDPEINPGL